MSNKVIAIFGGTFDPIHTGHIQTALEVSKKFNLDEIRFLPCKTPVHDKSPHLLAEHRVHMLELALENIPSLKVDYSEVERDTPSYMVSTLESIRNEYPKNPICLILALDAFLKFDTWHQWQKIPDLAHLIIVPRLGYELPIEGDVVTLMSERQSFDFDDLNNALCGRLFYVDTSTFDISSTKIREFYASGEIPEEFLPEAVAKYIEKHDLYRTK